MNFRCVVSSLKFRAIKMRILQFTQKHLAFYGITASQSIRKSPLNLRIFLGFFIFVSVFISNCIYLLHASNSKECAASIYAISLAVFVVMSFVDLNWKMEQTFEFISVFEEIIDKSMWKMCCIQRINVNPINRFLKLFQG